MMEKTIKEGEFTAEISFKGNKKTIILQFNPDKVEDYITIPVEAWKKLFVPLMYPKINDLILKMEKAEEILNSEESS